MGQDNHTRDLIAWQNQVIADRGLTLFAFHVAYVIGQHVNRQSRDAWPSQGRIAEGLSASRRAVQMAINQLVENGHLHVTVQRGRNGSNKYRPILKLAETEANQRQLNANEDAHLRADNANEDAHLNHQGAHGDAHPLRTGVRTNHLREPSERDSLSPSDDPSRKERKSAPRKGRGAPTDFDAWWEAYPKKRDKDAARKAYARAISRAGVSHTDLMAGATRYAVERAGEDSRFTKHPATWLNAGSWADEAGSLHTPTRPDSGGPRRAFSLLERFAIEGDDDE